MSWGAVVNGQPAHGLWGDAHLSWHINYLDKGGVSNSETLPFTTDGLPCVCTDNTTIVSYISHHSRLRLHPIFRQAQQILLWTKETFLSLKAVYIQAI